MANDIANNIIHGHDIYSCQKQLNNKITSTIILPKPCTKQKQRLKIFKIWKFQPVFNFANVSNKIMPHSLR